MHVRAVDYPKFEHKSYFEHT